MKAVAREAFTSVQWRYITMELCRMQYALAARVHPRNRMKLRMLARPTQLAMLKRDREGGVAAGWCSFGASCSH